MFKVNNKDNRSVFIVNFDYISHLALVSVVNFEHVRGLIQKSISPPWVFFTILNCTNDTKSRNASQLFSQKASSQMFGRVLNTLQSLLKLDHYCKEILCVFCTWPSGILSLRFSWLVFHFCICDICSFVMNYYRIRKTTPN